MTQPSMNTPQTPHDPYYNLGLALLELLNKPVLLELEHPDSPAALALHGTLLRAFDPPTTTAPPALTLMIGAHSVNIRLGAIKQTAYKRAPTQPPRLLAVHLLLTDGHALHIKPATTPPAAGSD